VEGRFVPERKGGNVTRDTLSARRPMLAPAFLLALTCLAPAAAPPAQPSLPEGAASRLRAARRVEAVVFSPDGKRLVGLTAAHAVVWDAASGRQTHQAKRSGSTSHLTFDGTTVRWVAGRALWAWKYASQDEPTALTRPLVSLSARFPQAASPDGKTLAVVTPIDRRFRLAHLTEDSADRILLNLSSGYGHRVVFSADGRLVALGNAADRSVTVFAVASGEQVRRLMPLDGGPSGAPFVDFAPDGRSLLKCDRDARLIETTTGGERFRLRRLGVPITVAWSRDGRLVARAVADSRVVVTDSFTGKEVFDRDTKQTELSALAFSRDGSRLATAGADASVIVWKVPAAVRLKPDLPLTTAWRDLAGSDSTTGFRAIRSLVAGADDTAKWLGERLKIRPAADGKRIAQLIKELDGEDFDVREAASDELTQIGSAARTALEAALKNPPSAEVKRRCAALLGRLGGSSVPASELRAARAVEVLEKIGSAEAKRVLNKLLQAKPSAQQAAEIRSALARMGGEG
jgi:dipeptidyl aminopeptidase/acylaminoacyl peptidase